jgi:hypothetical protein
VHDTACGGLGRLPRIHGPLRRFASTLGEKAGLVLEQVPGDDEALDLAGAFVDGGDADVSVEALHGVLAAEAVGAVDLDGLPGGLLNCIMRAREGHLLLRGFVNL